MKTTSYNVFRAAAILLLSALCSCGPSSQQTASRSKTSDSGAAASGPKGARLGKGQIPIMTPEGRLVAMLRFENAIQIKPALFDLAKPVFETYRTNGTSEMIVRAPQSFYTSKSNEVYSSGAISVATLDQKFNIEGMGFTWKASTSQLVISNRAHALIRRTLLEATNTTALVSTQSQSIDITSDQFQYDTESARFTQTVVVKDASGQMTSGLLTVHFAGNSTNKTSDQKIQKIEAEDHVIIDSKGSRVQAGKALYDMEKQTIRLLDHPAWKMEDNDGTSDLLIINRQNNALHAIGNVDLKVLTRTLMGTNSQVMGSSTNATNMAILNIKAADFVRTTNLTVFEGNVRAAQNDATLNCERLTLTIPGPSRQITEVLAERSVRILRSDTRAAADSAVFDIPQDTVTLRSKAGDPPMNWSVAEMKGQSSLLVLHPNSDAMEASGSLRIELPERKMSSLPGTNNTVTVTADLLQGTKTRGTFTDHVEVKDREGVMRSGLMTINSVSNQVETILAEKGVTVQRGDLIATGQQALYTASQSLIELTGSPRISDPRAHMSAQSFLLNTTNNSFRTKGDYKIEVGDLTAMKRPK